MTQVADLSAEVRRRGQALLRHVSAAAAPPERAFPPPMWFEDPPSTPTCAFGRAQRRGSSAVSTRSAPSECWPRWSSDISSGTSVTFCLGVPRARLVQIFAGGADPET